MKIEPTPEHTYILNELARIAEDVDAMTDNGNAAMLFALNERYGVEMGLAIQRGAITPDTLTEFLENTCMIASVFAGEISGDTYGTMPGAEAAIN